MGEDIASTHHDEGGGGNVKQSLEGAMQEALQKLFNDPAFIAALVR